MSSLFQCRLDLSLGSYRIRTTETSRSDEGVMQPVIYDSVPV